MANDLNKEWFKEYMEDLAEVYTNPKLTEKKIKIYFDFFMTKGFVKLQYEAAKNKILRGKKDLNFPSPAEILDNINVDCNGNEWI